MYSKEEVLFACAFRKLLEREFDKDDYQYASLLNNFLKGWLIHHLKKHGYDIYIHDFGYK